MPFLRTRCLNVPIKRQVDFIDAKIYVLMFLHMSLQYIPKCYGVNKILINQNVDFCRGM